MKYPDKFEKLIQGFQKFPGIGPKTALRYALFAIEEKNKDKMNEFITSLQGGLEGVKKCITCSMLTDTEKCSICTDTSRDNQLMIVENVNDVVAFEATGAYNGKYHIIPCLISPANGTGPKNLGIEKIIKRIKEENIKEIILGTSSGLEGDLTSMYISEVLKKEGIQSFRLGYGLPVSANIEYVDEITLTKALESKKEI